MCLQPAYRPVSCSGIASPPQAPAWASRAEIPGRHPAILAVVTPDSDPIRSLAFQDGDRIPVHETTRCPVVLMGRGAKHDALSVGVRDVRTRSRGYPRRGWARRDWTAHLVIRLIADNHTSGLPRSRDSDQVGTRRALPTRGHRSRHEHGSNKEAAKERAAYCQPVAQPRRVLPGSVSHKPALLVHVRMDRASCAPQVLSFLIGSFYGSTAWRLGGSGRASGRPVLQRSSDKLDAVGGPMHVPFGLLLIQSEARGLLASTDAHNITNERKRGSFGRIPVDEPARVEAAQLEDHTLGTAEHGPLHVPCSNALQATTAALLAPTQTSARQATGAPRPG